MAAHLLLRYALIVCLFFVPVKGTAALFAYAQKSGMQRQPVCAIQRRAAVDQPGHVTLRVLQIEILRTIVGDGHGVDLIVGEVQGSAASGRVNVDLRQRVTEVGIACPRSLARVDDLAAGIADVIDARLGAGADTLHQPAFKSRYSPCEY
ncbi:MAG: hypothetical protein J6I99_01690, partial [Oscillospiraceae bacterium]|nr:hypothetical protein [Oscillospiraceae bacterium]